MKEQSHLYNGHGCLLAGMTKEGLSQDSLCIKLVVKLAAGVALNEAHNDITDHSCLRRGLSY